MNKFLLYQNCRSCGKVMSPSFPLWKRGIKGDFFKDAQVAETRKISPNPSFSKRGTKFVRCQQPKCRAHFPLCKRGIKGDFIHAGLRTGSRLITLAILLLSSNGVNAQEPLRAGTIFSATQAPLWSAKEGRYFEKYGIKNLEVIQFSGGQPVTRALIG